MNVICRLVLLAALLGATQVHAQAPGLRMAFADNATFGSSSAGCSKSQIGGGGVAVVHCVPGANSYFLIPIMAPPAAEWADTTWQYRLHWQKSDAALSTCKVAVSFGALTNTYDFLPEWFTDPDVDANVVTYQKSSSDTRYVAAGNDPTVFETGTHVFDIGTTADCATIAACAGRLTLVRVYIDPTSSSTGCDIRAVEIKTN